MPIPMLRARRRSYSGTRPDSPSQRKIAGTRQAVRVTRAAVPGGNTRGRLSVMPPPVMWAMPLMTCRLPSSGLDHRQVRPVRTQQRLRPPFHPGQGTWLSTVSFNSSNTILRASE